MKEESYAFMMRKLIIEIRQHLGLSQQEFADSIKVVVRTITRWEAGDTIPSAFDLDKICEAHNLEIRLRFRPRAERKPRLKRKFGNTGHKPKLSLDKG